MNYRCLGFLHPESFENNFVHNNSITLLALVQILIYAYRVDDVNTARVNGMATAYYGSDWTVQRFRKTLLDKAGEHRPRFRPRTLRKIIGRSGCLSLSTSVMIEIYTEVGERGKYQRWHACSSIRACRVCLFWQFACFRGFRDDKFLHTSTIHATTPILLSEAPLSTFRKADYPAGPVNP